MSRKYNHRRQKNLFLVYIIIGLLLMLLPIIYFSPNYEDLQTKDIHVDSVEVKYRTKGSSDYYLFTVTGDRYEIRGDLTYEKLKEKLQPNTLVSVKYYRGLYVLQPSNFIKEMRCDGELLVTYSGDQQLENQIVMIVIGLVFMLIGFICYDYQAGFVRKIKRRIRKIIERKK